MTREEVDWYIDSLKLAIKQNCLDEKYIESIEALKDEPFKKAVSRDCDNCAYYDNGANDEACDGCFADEYEHPNFNLKAQPCEITDEQAIEHLQKSGWMQMHDKVLSEPYLCNNAVDREAVIKQIDEWFFSKEFDYTNATHFLKERMRNLSSVTPARKKGEWIKVDENTYRCNLCGKTVHKDLTEDMKIDYPYCHCGADMGGGE